MGLSKLHDQNAQNIRSFIRDAVKALKEKNLAIFGGAGLSVPAGFVTWKELLREAANDLGLSVDKEHHDLISLAQFTFNARGGRNRINQLLLNEFTRDAKMTENLKTIARLPIESYWTTNYDSLIEDAIKGAGRTPDVKRAQEDLATYIPKRDAVVYKMHGDITQPQKAVLTKDDYETYNVHRKLFTAKLQGDLISNTFVFIGFSFDDPNLDSILSRIRILLGEAAREHYCFFKRISEKESESKEDYIYKTTRQDYKIADLKRYHINALLVDEYAEITDILHEIESQYIKQSVFISGSAYEYGLWPSDLGQKLAFDLGYQLIDQDFAVVTGYGLGIGSAVVTGALEKIYSTNYRHIDERLIIRPFPLFGSNADELEKRMHEYRVDMISSAGIAVFLFGNKVLNGMLVDADGMEKEFAIAREKGLSLIPIGATGFKAKELAERVLSDFDNYHPKHPDLRPILEALNDDGIKPDEIAPLVLRAIKLINKV